MFEWWPSLLGLMVLLGTAVFAWWVSVVKRDVSIVDTLWSLMFLMAALTYAAVDASFESRALLVIILVAIWALRLSAYIGWRNWGQSEDRRYQAIRRRHEPHFWLKSLYIVFALQAGLAWIISLPLLAAITSRAPLNMLDLVGVGLWAVGMIFEAGGDFQLARFKADPANRGKVMNRGLWRYTRHPNYFGNFCIWWGFYLIALAAGAWWAIVAPLLMTFLLLRVSGVALLEKDIADRRPQYREYIARTNAFFPGPVRSTNHYSPRRSQHG